MIEGGSSKDYVKQEHFYGIMKKFFKFINKLTKKCAEIFRISIFSWLQSFNDF